MLNLGSHTRIALGYFIMAAALGVLLRSFPSITIPANYMFIVHTHSHIALLGWVYVGLTTLVYKIFVQNPETDKKYQKIFWFTQFTLTGMLFTFPFQGYALFSIIFSTLFLFASYWFFCFFRKYTSASAKNLPSYKCTNAALWFLLVSSLGPWTLGIIMNTLGAQSVWYRLAIYFYLHFLYNGFMILTLVGLFLYILEKRQIYMPPATFKGFFWSINSGIGLSFLLSALFTNPPLFFNFLGGIGALLQILAFGILSRTWVRKRDKVKALFSPFQEGVFITALILLATKMLLQLLTAFPYFANLATIYPDFIIAYLHWTFLGVISIGLLLCLNYFGSLRLSRKAYYLYLAGFIVTEALIFYKGIAAWQRLLLFDDFFEALTLGSTLIVVSLVLMLVTNVVKREK
jgi:hypothetical protein